MIDPSIPLQAGKDVVPLQNPFDLQSQANQRVQQYQNNLLQGRQLQIQTLAGNAMQAGIDPTTGQLDPSKMYNYLLQQPNGALAIGPLSQTLLARQQAQLKITGDQQAQNLQRQTYAAGLIAPLVADPNTPASAYHAKVDQAVADHQLLPEEAAQYHSQIDQAASQPGGLHAFGLQLEAAVTPAGDARTSIVRPDIRPVNQGGYTSFRDFNNNTNPGLAGTAAPTTATPDTLLQQQTYIGSDGLKHVRPLSQTAAAEGVDPTTGRPLPPAPSGGFGAPGYTGAYTPMGGATPSPQSGGGQGGSGSSSYGSPPPSAPNPLMGGATPSPTTTTTTVPNPLMAGTTPPASVSGAGANAPMAPRTMPVAPVPPAMPSAGAASSGANAPAPQSGVPSQFRPTPAANPAAGGTLADYPPGYAASQTDLYKASNDAYQRDTAQLSTIPTQRAALHDMAGLATQFATGPYAGAWANAKATIGQIFGSGTADKIASQPTSQGAYFEFQKDAHQLVIQQLGALGGGTNDKLGFAESALPNAQMSPDAVQRTIGVIDGNLHALQAKAQAATDYYHAHQTDPNWYTDFMTQQWTPTFDPRVFWVDSMPPAIRQQMLSEIARSGNKTDQQNFASAWANAVANKWITPPQPAGGQ